MVLEPQLCSGISKQWPLQEVVWCTLQTSSGLGIRCSPQHSSPASSAHAKGLSLPQSLSLGPQCSPENLCLTLHPAACHLLQKGSLHPNLRPCPFLTPPRALCPPSDSFPHCMTGDCPSHPSFISPCIPLRTATVRCMWPSPVRRLCRSVSLESCLPPLCLCFPDTEGTRPEPTRAWAGRKPESWGPTFP